MPMLFSPSIGCALNARRSYGCAVLPAPRRRRSICGPSIATHGSAISSLIPLTDKSIADELHDEHRCRVALVGHTLHSPSLFALVHPMVRTEGSGGAAWCGITVYLTLSDEDLFFLGKATISSWPHGRVQQNPLASARGAFRFRSELFGQFADSTTPFGGQESLIARNVSKTPNGFPL